MAMFPIATAAAAAVLSAVLAERFTNSYKVYDVPEATTVTNSCGEISTSQTPTAEGDKNNFNVFI